MSGYLFICLLTVVMIDAMTAWTSEAEDKMDALGRDFSLYADDKNLVTAGIRTMRAMLHSIQREGALYG